MMVKLPVVMRVEKTMEEYALRIGSEYIYEQDPYWRTDLGRYSPHYGTFKPIYEDEFYSGII